MQTKFTIKNIVPGELDNQVINVDGLVTEFFEACEPLEKDDLVYVFVDARTSARFCECHIPANKLVALSTVDVPLDPEEQPEYRANRDLVTSAHAFEVMKQDAALRRSFSNLVLEYTTEYDAEHPLKIIGGQHRFEAIKLATEIGINEYHGVKVYFGLDSEQRYDVQLISNTVIAVSPDLYDRMQETVKGPELRDWCKHVGLVEKDFADKRQRGKEITVKTARIFMLNYFRGKTLATKDFAKIDTTPDLCKTGEPDETWERLRQDNEIWTDRELLEAGKEFAKLVEAQRQAFVGITGRNVDFEEKALNYAVLSSWAFVAGLLHNNRTRLKRHFALASKTGKDPLNAVALAQGRHKTDPQNYRGLGYRTDAKERGRIVELFYLQAESGAGITKSLIDLAIKQYHAKQAVLDVEKAKSEFTNGRN
jgi:hypothetical protein